MRKVELTVYKFSELSKEVQKVVVERYRNERDRTSDDSEQLAALLCEYLLEEHGIVAEDIYYRLSSSQGDGVAFYGELDLEALCSKHPSLLPLVNELGGTRRMWARIYRIGSHYHHHNTMRLELGGDGDEANESPLHKKVTELLVTASKGAEAKGYEVLDSLRSDEALTEELENQDQEYTMDGREWSYSEEK